MFAFRKRGFYSFCFNLKNVVEGEILGKTETRENRF